MSVIVSDRKGRTDGPMFRMLEQINSPVPIVLMARTASYKFNEDLLSLDKYILVEASEMGWDWKFTDTHVWGKNTDQFPQFDTEHYKRFDDFVASKPPLLTFTRELLKKDVTETHVPIDYPCWFGVNDPVSEREFNNRPLSSFFFWGRSHEARVKLHGRMWTEATDKGFDICDNLAFFEKFMLNEGGRKIVSVHLPHYYRLDIKELLAINNLSKTSIALPGAGIKTFRHVESSYNSVMIKWYDELAWQFPWVGLENCITTFEGMEIKDLDYLLTTNLYEIYKAGVANCKNYQIDNYVKHIESIIQNAIA
jgi:hypothetical protein